MTALTETAPYVSKYRACGRPRRSGDRGPCANKNAYDEINPACDLHMTPEEKTFREGYRLGWRKGHAEGQRSGRESERSRIEYERRQLIRAAEREGNSRYLDDRGRQVVNIGGYAYAWAGEEPLKVGDRVMLPSNYVRELQGFRGPWEAEVTDLGSEYQGSLVSVIRKVSSE